MQIRGLNLFVDDRSPVSPYANPVVFSHGLLWSGQMFAPQVEALRRTHRTICYDHRGQGRSEIRRRGPLDMDTLCDDAIELIERLELPPVHFVGLSMGGFVGMRVASRRPDLVRSLTLMATAADAEPRANRIRYAAMCGIARAGGMRALVPTIMSIMCGQTFLADATRSNERARMQWQLEQNPRLVYRAVLAVVRRRPAAAEARAVQCPTLVLRGLEDVAIGRDRAVALVDLIPKSRFVDIPEAGHTLSLERPNTTNHELLEFLRSVESDPRYSSD